ncbi:MULTISPECIES: DUF2635 domain-containing protein [unclassified Pseudomonas]|uniref:DUF2635 domain-containing protein n=1 Tax=unclassified Pseudomonas TaxID=196821 RepID=UPI001AECA335|nr:MULTISPECIES: DUF2635 domain-containing protein [unclassified Pseudomonas]MBP2840440.1 DUF2635 domain-containing protein [Pseudomonas sp. PNP]MCX2709062.1 DUF2635 domain-containing protein [Pseudomonas sp. DCB_BG]
MTQITVYPVEGRIAPDPAMGDTVPAEGRPVTLDIYWQRRLNDGDVTKEKPTKAKAKAATGSAE